jgi:UDP-N-acetylmuramoyl-L-alanyl-D-glutamate--2,6-diaminopimelate ligase
MKSGTKSIYQLLDGWREAVSGTPHPQPPDYHGTDAEISGFVEHTDHVVPGSAFVARVRTGTDGHPYLGEAVERGASLIIGQKAARDIQAELGSVPYLQGADSALLEAWLAGSFYDFPSRQLYTIGVTGTDGKTTTSNLIFHILREAGIRTGMLSTLKAVVGEIEEPLAPHVTTPEAPVIQSHLRRMVDQGMSHCVLEVTSHGLAQERVAAIDFDMAVVTNITHEHLDYHGDYRGYFAAKVKLFQALTMPAILGGNDGKKDSGYRKVAILNIDDSSFQALASIPVPKLISYGLDSTAEVRAKEIDIRDTGSRFTISMPKARNDEFDNNISLSVSSPLVGGFNISNMLAAAAVAYELVIDPEIIRLGLESPPQLTGRMERIDLGQSFQVIIDFAHTPNGLERAIEAARAMVDGKIITVFGSAGKRDVKKRKTMSEISARLADFSVLTAEDPRTDSLDEILAMMAAGCLSQGGREGFNFWRIPDRGQAIHFALSLAGQGDLVLVCGKGHEQTMCFGIVEHPWDDIVATKTAIDAVMCDRPMPDLGLPTFDQDFSLAIPRG